MLDSQSRGTGALRVATYNVHSCVGTDRRYDPERILHVIKEIDADIIALQEVGGYFIDGVEQAHFFEHRLGMKALMGPNMRRRQSEYGNLLLAKGDLGYHQLIQLTVVPFEPRSALDCIVETPAGDVRVIAAHLGLFRAERRRQIKFIAERMAKRPSPFTLIMGDFNIFGAERNVLQQIGAPERLPKLRSFPSRYPLVSLDRIWTIPNDALVNQHVHRTPLSRVASDHLPMVAEITPIDALAEAVLV
ncbi:MAG TPA: endonuclease/exonuclease/phosphatase family protein [Alphaproteobacteria bacterium]|jgi:endonuclease/exonuclease/phosphatase family metal-dependent hydrolase